MAMSRLIRCSTFWARPLHGICQALDGNGQNPMPWHVMPYIGMQCYGMQCQDMVCCAMPWHAILDFNLAPLAMRRDIAMLGILYKVAWEVAHKLIHVCFSLRPATLEQHRLFSRPPAQQTDYGPSGF